MVMTKSILKKPSSSTSNSPSAPLSREDRNRETALHHARLIQQRKDVEAGILQSTEGLLDCPSSSTSDPARPSSADASRVKALLMHFQPSDYDSLVEERNIDGKCGYVLCPHSPKQQDTKARFRIIQNTGKAERALKVVKTSHLERWCSEGCGKMALYLRVQMSEVPAWMRSADTTGEVHLYGDGQPTEYDMDDNATKLVAELGDRAIEDSQRGIESRLAQLSIERGERGTAERASGLVDVTLHENTIQSGITPEPPSINGHGLDLANIYSSVEGYNPIVGGNRARLSYREDEEEERSDLIRTI
ncbi:hypothetical protein MMC24_001540 [Lignoscripta atroalba]|nr:hypothetical protein [Lignoscripta atroalba]